jgi:hypothetical protein
MQWVRAGRAGDDEMSWEMARRDMSKACDS